ncbi:hypothetical protein [Rhizobium sp. BK377]|uniref:hypothetical protein n=1 Tax=Rhizobium sp. BK377 TaxID=2587058 RepID=UPI00160E804A|nr:hypothetical protein [Rhizobium sp. BK377]MBB3459425.1 hypothetical protein [Rhizobium sp. BK377]
MVLKKFNARFARRIALGNFNQLSVISVLSQDVMFGPATAVVAIRQLFVQYLRIEKTGVVIDPNERLARLPLERFYRYSDWPLVA